MVLFDGASFDEKDVAIVPRKAGEYILTLLGNEGSTRYAGGSNIAVSVK